MKLTRTSDERARDWGRLLLWTPLLVGGVLAVVLATRPTRLRRALRRVWSESAFDADFQQHLEQAIVGIDKDTITAVLGAPRTALHRGVASTDATAQDYLAADTWYYPFDRATRTAVVIEFARGIAQRAELIQSPLKDVKA